MRFWSKISKIKKYWNDHKIVQWFALWGLIAIFIIRIPAIFALHAQPPIPMYFKDFFHTLHDVQYFVSGQDYAQMATHPTDPQQPDYSEYAPVFPGVTFFYLPFVPLSKIVVQSFIIFLNILFPFLLAMFVARVLKLPSTWQFWRPSKEAFTLVILFFVIFFTRPVLSTQLNGQVSIIVTLLVLYSVFYGSGIAWGAATALKFTMTPFYLFQFIISKRYEVMLKGLVTFAFFLLFPVIFQPNLLKLYYDFGIKVQDHFNIVDNIDKFEGCQHLCWALTEMAWIKNQTVNLLIKAFSIVLLLYAYWKNWGERKRVSLHTLMLTGAVLSIISYHRFQDVLLVIIPLLMVIIINFQKRQWKQLVFPTIIYGIYLLPGKLWNPIHSFVGSLFKNVTWVYPRVVEGFPLDSVLCFILILYAAKKIWEEKEVYILLPHKVQNL